MMRPPGPLSIEMRFRPWDVPLGIALMVVGLLVSCWWLVVPAGFTVPFLRKLPHLPQEEALEGTAT